MCQRVREKRSPAMLKEIVSDGRTEHVARGADGEIGGEGNMDKMETA